LGASHQATRAEPHISFTFEGNIAYFDSGALLGGDWSGDQFRMNGNVYSDSRRLPVSFSGHNLAEWRRQGQEADSLVADPQFARRELRFTPLLGSPVWKLGWKKIDTTTIGPRVSPGLSASLMH
jgi:hypothetical protein